VPPPPKRRLTALDMRIATPLDTAIAQPDPKRAAPFYLTPEWRRLIATILNQRGPRCEQCGRTGTRLFGDHIIELQDGGAPLDPSNIQMLCGSCHSHKTLAARAARFAQRT